MGRGAGSIANLARQPDARDHANRARHPTRPTRKNGLSVSSRNRETTKKLGGSSSFGPPNQRLRRSQLFQTKATYITPSAASALRSVSEPEGCSLSDVLTFSAMHVRSAKPPPPRPAERTASFRTLSASKPLGTHSPTLRRCGHGAKDSCTRAGAGGSGVRVAG